MKIRRRQTFKPLDSREVLCPINDTMGEEEMQVFTFSAYRYQFDTNSLVGISVVILSSKIRFTCESLNQGSATWSINALSYVRVWGSMF